ncbi:serine/threonine-protein phosphatase 6 regulatory ankyrin repeat subunit B-like [Mytilus edulis]|uniref:serine/threonine-protein phosphatase 6 regulatory ankyrin repeat subunit B-like n=1 Tax=Mytilus edulis TaxID=6550 RepID=UPI0039EF93CA
MTTLITMEESNYIKIALLLLRISPRAVRIQFDYEFHPDCLNKTLNSNKCKLTDLKHKGRINKEQWNLLFPRTGEGSSKHFDSTLMICLIRNLTPIQISDKPPISANLTVGADLSRIKCYRNKIAHSEDGFISSIDFQDYWNDIKMALIRLGGDYMETECDTLYAKQFDTSQREDHLSFIKTQNKLIKLEEELDKVTERVKTLEEQLNDPIPKNLKDLFTKEIELWRTEMMTFYITTGATKVLKQVENNSFVVVTGNSGMGKSAISHYIALTLQINNGYQIIPLTDACDIVKYYNPPHDQIFIIDDIFGRFSAEQSILYSLERLKTKIGCIRTENSTFRILATCRLLISNTPIFKKFSQMFQTVECNLLSKEFEATVAEKRKIAGCYIDQKTITHISDDMVRGIDMFPLLCVIHRNRKQETKVLLFQNPYDEFEKELDEMYDNNKCCILGLALLVIHNNNLRKDYFYDNIKFIEAFDAIVNYLNLPSRPTLQYVLSCLQTLKEIYIREKANTITTLHDKIFDIIALYFGKKIPKVILQHANGNFIRDRIQFASVNKEHDEFTILIPPELECVYFVRMGMEIERKSFVNVFNTQQMKHRLFQEKIIKFLNKNEKYILAIVHNQWPLFLSTLNGYKEIVKFIISKRNMNNAQRRTSTDKNSPMAEHVETIHHQNGNNEWLVDTQIFLRHRHAPLLVACKEGRVDIVELLLTCDYDINIRGHDLDPPLVVACKEGHTEIMSVLLKNKCCANVRDEFGRTALHTACGKGYMDIVHLLLLYNCNINQTDRYKRTPLFIASENDQHDIVKVLLDFKSDVNIPNSTGKNALHVACQGRNMTTINYLLATKRCNINQVDTKKETPLFSACKEGHNDVVELLISNNADLNIRNIFGETVLHIACIQRNYNTVKILLKSNIDINQTDSKKRTPLFIASVVDRRSSGICGYKDIVRILLDHYADVSICNRNNQYIPDVARIYGYADIIDIFDKYQFESKNSKNEESNIKIFNASKEGRIEVIHNFLGKEYSLNIRNKYGQTPLHVACIHRRYNIIKLLLNNNCDINAVDNNNKSALSLASEIGDEEIVLQLDNNNADVNISNCTSQSPIHIACEFGYTKIVKTLLRTCSINLGDSNNCTPLYLSSKYGRIDIVQLLISKNADINYTDNDNRTPLLVACEAAHIDIIKLLIDNKVDINLGNNNNETPLHIACKQGDGNIAQLLITHGADVNCFDNEGQTPLHLASNVYIVETLIRNNCNTNITDIGNKTPLFVYCKQGKFDDICLLIDNDADINICDNTGQSPLHAACNSNADAYIIVKMLINKNSALNTTDNRNRTPLMIACENGKHDIVQILIDNKADVNISNNEKESPLFVASSNGQTNIAKIIIENSANIDDVNNKGQTPLFIACERGNYDIVNLLISNNSDVNLCSYTKDTIITTACKQIRLESLSDDSYLRIVKILLDCNCRINQVDNENKTPLFYASGIRNDKLVQLLIDNPADLHIRSDDGESPLHVACYCGFSENVKILLQTNCDINMTDNRNRTPLHMACVKGHDDIVQILLDINADLNLFDDTGQTVLHVACKKEYPETLQQTIVNSRFFNIVKLLLENKCPVNKQDKHNDTPLLYACSVENEDVVQLLIDNEADINVVNNDGQSPLHVASYSGRLNNAKLLVRSNCEINQADRENKTPLYIACEQSQSWKHNYHDIVQLLVDYNADVNICGSDDESPLHVAVLSGSFITVKIMLRTNVNIDHINNKKKTALHVACEKGHYDIIKLLLNNKADVDIKDKGNQTALDLACKLGHTNIMKLIESRTD